MKKSDSYDPHNVSHTAVTCARSLAQDSEIPYAPEVWDILKNYDSRFIREGNNAFMRLFRKLVYFPRVTRILRTTLEGRFVAINEALMRERYPSVIEFASGFSPRGLAFTRNHPEIVYIESDLPDSTYINQDIKKRIREDEKQKGLPLTPNLVIEAADITKRADVMALGKIYSKSGMKKPLAVVHAGLFPYLTKGEQEKARDNIAELFRKYSPQGVWITPDLYTKDFAVQLLKNPLLRLMIHLLQKRIQRKLTFFEDRADIEQFMKEGGFEAEFVPSSHLVGKLTCVKKKGYDLESLRSHTTPYDIFKMRLK